MLKSNSVLRLGLVRATRATAPSNRWISSTAGTEPPIPPSPMYTLSSGDTIPPVGLGTWRISSEDAGKAVKAALSAGYRHIDCAWEYGNEEAIGNAIHQSGVQRQDLWLTSKLWNAFHSPEDVEYALDETLAYLGTSYLDMYLIHWPVAILKEPYLTSGRFVVDKPLSDDMFPTWRKLEELVDKGKVKNIGVCNFTIWRFEQLMKNSLRYHPLVNQVELSYWNPQPSLVAWAKSRKVLLEASSPFGGMRKAKETLELPIFTETARLLGITPAQVVLSWLRQRGVVVLPKSIHPDRIEENIQAVTLPQELFEKIERAAVSHPQKRMINPSGKWGFNFDIFGLT